MKISTKERYALRSMLELAQKHEKGYIPVSEIAKSQQISAKYLEQVFSFLKKNNLVVSEKGAQGGYKLSKDPAETTTLEIIRAFGKEINVNPLAHHERSGKSMEPLDEFIETEIWNIINSELNEITANTTLKSLLLKGECLYE